MENSKLDTPRKKRGVHCTPSDTIISCGKHERALLVYLKNNPQRLNIKAYARENNLNRSSVYSSLDTLSRKGFIQRNLGDNRLTRQGETYVEAYLSSVQGGVQNSRQECREINKLSTHWHKFTLPITNKSKFKIDSLKKLKYDSIKENRLLNLHQTIISFNDAKIVINPKQVILSIFETISDNVEDSDLKCLHKALEYAERLDKLGLETSGVMLEEGHWARVESHLADWLYQNIDKRYYLELDGGKKFWIDCSGGKKPEDEINDKQKRERIDNFLTQITSQDWDLQDINKIKESLGFMTKLEASRLQDKIEENKTLRARLDLPKVETEIRLSEYIN